MRRFKPNIKKNIFITLVILVFIFVTNFYSEKIFNAKKESVLENTKIGGSFNLIDQDGKKFSSVSIKKFKVIYFGYTFCPDVCPFDILKLSNFFTKKRELKKYIQPIFISVDPERDKPEVVKNFLENFDENIIGLTGSTSIINKTLKNFKVYKKKAGTDPLNKDYLIDHTALFYILDENDNYVTHLGTKNFEEEMNIFLKNKKFF